MPLKTSILGSIIALSVGLIVVFTAGQNSIDFYGIPLIAVCFIYSYIIHWIFFVHGYLFQTEHYFDATGSFTFVSLSLFLIFVVRDFYAFLICSLVMIWSLRLGSFLFSRVKRSGRDTRFTEMKKNFFWFFMTWNLSALWVFLSYVAGMVAVTSKYSSELSFIDFVFCSVGFLVWLSGFVIEVVADNQKKKFKEDLNNNDKFISHGLWSWSRHPNYFGEILLWIGITIIALPVFKGWDYIALISPVFIYYLLVKVSGIPMLEKSANEKWGSDPNYIKYKENTNILFLRKPTE
ncbi:MAG: DUF1295 domain-containing protein [Pseudomonadota bacterium]|nr:DUF1295 domain-containing protein [Pseudomonadota bacterium]